MSRTRAMAAMVALIVAAGCGDGMKTPAGLGSEEHAHFSSSQNPQMEAAAVAYMAAVNQRLAEAGASYAVGKLEYLTKADGQGSPNHIVFANDRTLRLPYRWVPGDPRRLADGNNLTYYNYLPLMFANVGTAGEIDAEPPVDASFDTWNALQCSGLDIVKRPFTGVFPSALFAGGDPFVADIVTLGFLPGVFFDLVLGPGASANVLGVTFTFFFITFDDDGNQVPTDVDNDRRIDTALKEVWYNDDFNWSTTGTSGIDIETVALHENGHALEMGHFGRLSFNLRQGTFQASPRAVMNAAYLGPHRHVAGTDNASYCSNFGNWPS